MFEFLAAFVIFGLMLVISVMGFMSAEKSVNTHRNTRRVSERADAPAHPQYGDPRR